MIRLAVGGRVGVDFQNLRLLIYHGHAAMLALSTFAHNRQNPTKGLLPELLLLLHDQTIVKTLASQRPYLQHWLVFIQKLIVPQDDQKSPLGR
ncbi:hypothetical protein CMV_026830 [Castanea mollissima]|nr:hypothetical protein CMV_026830 [Castanea mollissima]